MNGKEEAQSGVEKMREEAKQVADAVIKALPEGVDVQAVILGLETVLTHVARAAGKDEDSVVQEIRIHFRHSAARALADG